jgi:hypothetical protein
MPGEFDLKRGASAAPPTHEVVVCAVMAVAVRLA